MSQTELFFFLSYEKNIGLNTCRIALILRVIYGIDDNTFDRRLFCWPLVKYNCSVRPLRSSAKFGNIRVSSEECRKHCRNIVISL